LIILIQNGLNIDSSDEEGNTLLVYAIQEKKEDIVYYLLKYHSSLKLINTKIEILKPLIQIKNTILFNGINLIKNIRILKMLIQQGIDINSKDKEGKTLLVYAIEEEDKFIVNYLLENHASIQLINQNIKYLRKLTKIKKENKKELLENFEFRMKNKFNIIKILLEYGLDIDAKDEKGKTLLLYAIEDENELIVNYLLENHASIQPINENIKYLKELTKNNKENEKELLKTFEFRMKNKLNIIKLLLKYGLDINAEDEERKTLLLYVIDEVNESLFYYLLKNKTSLESLQAINIKVLLKFIFNTIENENENVLNKLSKYANKEKEEEKYIEIIKLLIQSGLDINDKDEEGNTILIYAIEARKVSVIQYLLERNASLEPVNSKVEILKPLITNIIPKSCLSGEICYIDNLNFNILKLLIDYGLNMENNKKLLHYAIQNSNNRIVNYLFDYRLTIDINGNFGKILLNQQKMKNSNPEIDQLIENLLNNKKFISIINRNIKLIRSLFNSIQKRTILLKLLIQNGLDVNAVDEDKHSLLYYAIETDYQEIIPYLFKYGAKIDSIYHDISVVKNLFIHTVESNDKIRFNILKILIENGLNINYEDHEGKTLLLHAIDTKHYSIINYLLKSNAYDKLIIPKSKLKYLISEYDDRMINYLFDYGITTEIKSYDGRLLLRKRKWE